MLYVVELMQSLGQVYAKRMFGGHGVFLDGLMFALIADGILYFKSDEETHEDYKQRELDAFRYMKKGKEFTLSHSMSTGKC